MRIHTRLPAAALTLALAALAACMPRLRQPEVRVASVRLGGLGLRGGLVYAQLHVVNPNGFGLEAAGLTYDLDLAEPRPGGEPRWVDFAQGTFREPIRVAGHDSTLVEVPVEFTYEGAGAALRSILDMGTFTYRVAGTVELREPMRRDVPYRHQGTVSLAGVR